LISAQHEAAVAGDGIDAGRMPDANLDQSASGGAGPYLSIWQLAEALAADYDVILALPEKTRLSHPGFAVVYYNRRSAGLLASTSDIVICEKSVLESNPLMAETAQPVQAGLKTLLNGDIETVMAEGATEDIPQGSDEPVMLIWKTAAAETDKGLRYYFARLRYHISTGGARSALARGATLMKKKMGGKGN